MVINDSGGVIPPVLNLLQTVEGKAILPTRFDRSRGVVHGQIDDYNVSGDGPAPVRSWSLSSGKCDSGDELHDLKEDNALSLARRIPLR